MATKTGGELYQHQQSFNGFVRLLQASVAGIVLVLVLMAIFLL